MAKAPITLGQNIEIVENEDGNGIGKIKNTQTGTEIHLSAFIDMLGNDLKLGSSVDLRIDPSSFVTSGAGRIRLGGGANKIRALTNGNKPLSVDDSDANTVLDVLDDGSVSVPNGDLDLGGNDLQSTKRINSDIYLSAEYNSLQAAVNAAEGGGKLFVNSGSYSEDITVTDELTMEGMDLNSTVIDGKLTVNDGAFVTVRDIRIDGDGTRACDFDSFAGHLNNVRFIDDLQIGTSSGTSSNTRVTGCMLTGNDITVLNGANKTLIDGNARVGTITDNDGSTVIGANS